MKRGFLNTEKAKSKLTAEADITRDSTVDKGKGKVKADSQTPSRTHEIPPDAPLLDLHSLPHPLKSKEEKRRFIFRHWPRDPKGKIIVPSNIHGKEAGNGLNLWGATLYDFYYVRRIPSNIHGLTISTGSKLAKVMKSFGELEFAQDELGWASHEADPREILAWDPAQATMIHERRVHASSGATHRTNKKKSMHPEVSVAERVADAQGIDPLPPASDSIESRNDTVEAVDDPTPVDCANKSSGKSTDSMDDIQPPSNIPLESPFHPAHYPSPWPLAPFESTCSPFPLQRTIPVHLLPKKLCVHDPWNLLRADIVDPEDRHKAKAEAWGSKTDHIHAYSLKLPPEWQSMADLASKIAAVTKDEVEERTMYPRETEGPAEEPAIRMLIAEKPRKPTHVPEAHLYISPKGRLGTGHHSIVYEADLELPRDLFCESTYCDLCLAEQAKIEVGRLKESGEWERQLNEEAQRYNGRYFTYDPAAPECANPVQLPPRYVGYVKVRDEREPLITIGMVAAEQLGETPPADAPSHHFARVSDPAVHHYVDYDGAVITIRPNVQWQNPSLPETICAHRANKTKPVPRTATFRVAVKLSLPGDPHLEREASNYLKFPTHFFQHWSGYNIVPPLHDPTPVGALVPQFFGYYMPDEIPQAGDEDKSGDKDKDEDEDMHEVEHNDNYLSPILLIEHCGKPICADKLSIDDQQECAALLFRFHSAGWLHESFAERNILIQKRHPTRSPMEDGSQPDDRDTPYRRGSNSFRLIDFGRSVQYTDASKRAVEEMEGKTLFGIL